jgi:hypothetical protein
VALGQDEDIGGDLGQRDGHDEKGVDRVVNGEDVTGKAAHYTRILRDRCFWKGTGERLRTRRNFWDLVRWGDADPECRIDICR